MTHTKTLKGFLSAVLSHLHAYYRQPLTTAFKQFRAGVIYFAVGFVAIIMATTQLPPSVQQEVIVFCGMVMAGIGFFMALMAEIRLLIGRFVRFFDKQPPKI